MHGSHPLLSIFGIRAVRCLKWQMTKTSTLVALDRSRQTAEGNARSEEILYHRRERITGRFGLGETERGVVPFIVSLSGFQQQSRFESDIPSRRSLQYT